MANSYPVFQPQAPHIDISLFGDAAQAGAKLGQEIPSAITSAVSGVEQGVKFATDIQAEDARTDLTKVQTENAQLELDRNKANASAQLEEDQSKLTLETDQADQADKQITAQNDFYDKYSQADLATKGQILKSGNPIFLQNPGLYKNALQQYSSALPPDSPELPQINRLLGHATLDDYNQKKVLANQTNWENAKASALNGEGGELTGQIVDQLKVPEEAAPNAVRLEQAGVYKIDPDTNRILIGTDGKPEKEDTETQKENKAINSGKYIAISTQSGTEGLVVSDNVSADAYKSYIKYKTNQSLMTGQQLSYAKRNFDTNLQNQNAKQNSDPQGTSTDVPTFGSQTSSEKTPASSNVVLDPIDSVANGIAKPLHVDPQILKDKAAPALEKLNSQITEYIRNPLTRANPTTMLDYTSTVKTISKSITDSQFENSDALQSQYTDSQVQAYNAQKVADLQKQISPYRPYFLQSDQFASDLASIGQVDTPADLYYAKQKAIVESTINKYVSDAIAFGQKQKSTIPNAQNASNSTVSFFTGLANGSGSK